MGFMTTPGKTAEIPEGMVRAAAEAIAPYCDDMTQAERIARLALEAAGVHALLAALSATGEEIARLSTRDRGNEPGSESP